MTTVINLNILNVFGLKINKNTVNNNQPDSGNTKSRRNAFPVHRTIDVTPSNPVVSYEKPDTERLMKIPVQSAGKPEVLTCYPKKSGTYNLRGYSTACFMPKGTNIDSYA